MFHQATIELIVAKMDCGNKGINRDMQKALKADQYPVIQIKLEQALLGSTHMDFSRTSWTPIEAQTIITIAGVQQIVPIHLEGISRADESYQFRGKKQLRMSDFAINPPKAMLGLIQVEDEVFIHFDLLIKKW